MKNIIIAIQIVFVSSLGWTSDIQDTSGIIRDEKYISEQVDQLFPLIEGLSKQIEIAKEELLIRKGFYQEKKEEMERELAAAKAKIAQLETEVMQFQQAANFKAQHGIIDVLLRVTAWYPHQDSLPNKIFFVNGSLFFNGENGHYWFLENNQH